MNSNRGNKMRKRTLLFLAFSAFLSSCACDPEDVAQGAMWGLKKMIGEGFMPSEEIRTLGKFQGVSVNLSQSTTDDVTQSIIFLKLENGDPLILGNQPEILARKCAELYIRDFQDAPEYSMITVQFVQTDPRNPENYAMQEYTFETKDF